MIVGTTLFKMDGNPYYSPQFPRGGLAARFAADVTQVVGTPSVTISVEHRNSEDTTWTAFGAFPVSTSVLPLTVDLAGCMEIMRFKYEFDVGDAATAGIHFLMQAPSWRPY